MGLFKLPKDHPEYSGKHRRLDMKMYPNSLYSFALLYFTGNDHFNRSMRHWCKNNGWSLSDKGLQQVLIRKNNEKIVVSESVTCKTEEEIFEKCGLPYYKPSERNVWEDFSVNNITDDNDDNHQ